MTGQQLKNSILQMAVQGKLVPQDPNDEPASVLLERIRAEKEKLIKDGKIKKEKNPSVIFRGTDNLPYEKIGKNNPICIADEVPFDIPDSWEWCRLLDVANMFTGNSINASDKVKLFSNLDHGYYYIGTKDVGFNYEINYDNGIRIPTEYTKFKIAPPNSILMCIEGGSAGRKISITNKAVCFGNKLCCFDLLGINELFLFYYLQSPIFASVFKENKSGIIGGVSVNNLKKLFFPLPPLKEQHRIVEELKTILPYVEKYNDLEEKCDRLNKTFPDLLKKSILQEAVQGKLVPQDENDEPASVLLDRIREEKQRLIAEGKIKKDKHESVIFKRDNSHYEKQSSNIVCIDDELPFEIPNSWIWERLGSIGETNIGLTYKPSDKTDETGKLVLRSSNIKDGRIVYDDNVFVNCNIPERSLIHKGDLLICVRNGSRNLVGKSAIVDIDNVAFGAFMAKFSSKINLYIKIFLDSPVFRNQLDSVKTETINQITQDMLKKQLIPIPPIEEQKRIVQRVNILFNKISTL